MVRTADKGDDVGLSPVRQGAPFRRYPSTTSMAPNEDLRPSRAVQRVPPAVVHFVELRQLEHFLAVVEEGTFTAAAARVFMVQSSLSASLMALERELGTELFI